jgi:aspartate/methionine/tyrosine aminotransferase
MQPLRGNGGFFLMAETSRLTVPEEYLRQTTSAAPEMTRDWALCRWLACEAGVIAIPCAPFFSSAHKHRAANLVRFAFCKSDETLIEACDRLAALAPADN